MKNLTHILLFCLIFNFSYAQWTSQSPVLPQKQGLYDLRISPSNNQVVWSICNKYTVQSSVLFQDPSADALMITRSNDGGNSWHGTTSPNGAGLFASNISPVSDSIAWISYISGNDGSPLNSYIYKTVDGGATWVQQLQEGFPTNSGYVNLVYFWDTQTGIAIGDPTNYQGSTNPYYEIWRTTDGGQNWIRLAENVIPALESAEYGWSGHSSYDVIGSTIWFETMDISNFPTVGGSRLFKSTNKGMTWEAFDFQGLYGISFADSLNGIALKGIPWVGEGQINIPICKTTDGGETWQESGNIGGQMVTSAELIPVSLSILATTRENNFGTYSTQISHDWGQTWTVLDTSDMFVAGLSFANPSIGYGGDWQRVPSKPFNMYKYSGNPITGTFTNKSIDAKIEISPNPTINEFVVNIDLPSSEEFVILLNNINGQLISKMDANSNGDYSFDLSAYPSGTYILTLTTQKGYLTKTILKQ